MARIQKKYPDQLTWRQIADRVLQDDQLDRELVAYAHRKKCPKHQATIQARTIYKKMVATYRSWAVRIMYHLSKKIIESMFEKVQFSESSLQTLTLASTKGSILFLPNHRSHLDYILLSYSLYVHGHAIPRIAAGDNLSFFPAGSLFRRSGGYFIRRSLKGDQLYSTALKAYIRWLTHQGITQEFFIEGGRSRTGRLGDPKLGLLTFQVESFLRNPSRDLLIIPTSITYAHVPEERALAHECMGLGKTKESVWSLMKSAKKLKQNHGKVYISFEEPISLSQFFKKEMEESNYRELKSKIRTLAQQVMVKIQLGFHVTETQVSSALLLNDCVETPIDRACNTLVQQYASLLSEHKPPYSDQTSLFDVLKSWYHVQTLWSKLFQHFYVQWSDEEKHVLQFQFPYVQPSVVSEWAPVKMQCARDLLRPLFYYYDQVNSAFRELGANEKMELYKAELKRHSKCAIIFENDLQTDICLKFVKKHAARDLNVESDINRKHANH